MTFNKKFFSIFTIYISLLFFSVDDAKAQQMEKPLRLAVAGITHGHVPWILNRKDQKDIQLVGIFETDTALIKRYTKSFKLDPALFYTNLQTMLDVVKPQAVVAFGSTYEHLTVVQAAAPKGIHVMVEKPLATTVDQANKMMALAKRYNIHLLTNYETSWYATTEKAYQLVNDSNYVGAVKKVVFHHGHQGPKKINVNQEFFKWLTDPVQNGGGALMDFGCYGANIMTYLMKGEVPLSVTAVTRNYQPQVYPKVDDEATIVVNYANAHCIIQASWNWPFNRKDMEVYGETGYVKALDQTQMQLQNIKSSGMQAVQVKPEEVKVYTDPFSYFADVINGKIKVTPQDLYSLENNVLVVRILEAARKSAETKRTVYLQ